LRNCLQRQDEVMAGPDLLQHFIALLERDKPADPPERPTLRVVSARTVRSVDR
jgi:hypothetical protein